MTQVTVVNYDWRTGAKQDTREINWTGDLPSENEIITINGIFHFVLWIAPDPHTEDASRGNLCVCEIHLQ